MRACSFATDDDASPPDVLDQLRRLPDAAIPAAIPRVHLPLQSHQPVHRLISPARMEDALGEPASAVHDLIVVGTAFGGEVIGQGEISSAFRWVEPGRKDDPREILEREGIRSTAGARAYSSQRLPIEALHDLRSAAEEDTDPAE